MVRLPLEGIRVVESTYVVAFPYAAGMLADMGAEVIKIEGTGHADITRNGGLLGGYPDNTAGKDPWNRPGSYNQINRGKHSLTLDLSTESGRETLIDLLKVTDVFMENFTPRVMRRWGLDYPNMKKIKPDIIMVSNTGYGHGEGPWTMYPAQATTQEGTHGHCSVTGYRNDIPSKAGVSFSDFLSCWSGLFTIASALRYRNRTGKGQWIDVAMYQLGAYLIGEYIADYTVNGRIGERMGNRHPWRAPQGCYPCAGNDQWCVLSVGDDEEWAALCRVIRKPELIADKRFGGSANRLEHHDELDKIIAEWTKGLEKYQVMERLQNAGVPAGPVFDSRDCNLSPQHWARGFLEKVEFPPERDMGTRVLMGRPYRMSKTPVKIKMPAPKLGDGNHQFLVETLGYSEEKCEELHEANIIGDKPLSPRPLPTMSLDDIVNAGILAYHDPAYKKRLGI